MRISKDTVVAIEYTIRNEDGLIVDTNEGRGALEYIHGYRQIVPGVEDALMGLSAGCEVEVVVAPECATASGTPRRS